MKSLAIINLVIALMFIPIMVVSCNCTDDDTTAIKNIINSYWDAYNQGYYAQALTYCTNVGDEDDEVAQMTAMKEAIGNVTVQSIEGIYISGPSATANVALYMAGETYTNEVRLVKLYGGWKIDIKYSDKNVYVSAQEELDNVAGAVAYAMLDVSVGELDPGGTVSSTDCNVTYNGGTLLPIGNRIVGGIASLTYVYSVDTNGNVHAITGPLA